MEITRERWDEAQAAECLDHLGNLQNSPDSMELFILSKSWDTILPAPI